MTTETKKIQIVITKRKITITDRMPIKFVDIFLFLSITSSFAVFFLGATGIIYSLIFSLGYVLFRYFAWMIWKKIEINLDTKELVISSMLFHKNSKTKILTNKFDFTHLFLKDFTQSGMQRAMIQYQNHKLNDLMLLTHKEDIELIKKEIFNVNCG